MPNVAMFQKQGRSQPMASDNAAPMFQQPVGGTPGQSRPNASPPGQEKTDMEKTMRMLEMAQKIKQQNQQGGGGGMFGQKGGGAGGAGGGGMNMSAGLGTVGTAAY